MNKFYRPKNDLPNYIGDGRLKAYINKEKTEDNKCVYCGNKADTREHLPTKGIFSRGLSRISDKSGNKRL